MGKKAQKNTKSKIVSAAWKLFYEQGYDATTVDDIILESGTSKGSFYHYFDGKDALLGSLAYLFDEKYEQLSEEIDENMNSVDALAFLNRELFEMIENRIDIDLLSRLYSTQLTTKGEKHLLDRNRVYYKLLRKTVCDGQQKGEITKNSTVNDIVRLYALEERAVIYDWCLCNGEYSLREYGQKVIGIFLESVKC
ncbi:MAG: TetR/AcrR family transcriptional regulator [Acutalibacteraceae bacterium]